MRGWSRAGKALYWAQVVAAAALLGIDLSHASPALLAHAWIGPVLFLAADIAANLFPIRLRDFEFTVSGIVVIAAIIVFPPPAATLIALIATVIGDIAARKAAYKTLANAALITTTVIVASSFFHTLSDPNVLDLNSGSDFFALAVLFASYYFFNVVPLMLTLAIATRRRVLHVLHANIQSIYLDVFGTLVFALLPAFVWRYNARLLPVLLVMGIVVYKVFELANRLRRETQDALATIVDIVDARDPYTFDHSLLVADLSRRLAEELVGDPNQVEDIVQASHLHDIGKIGVSDTILLKPGRLTAEEYEKMKEHPEIGRRILASFSMFKAGSEIVYAHQEHYDGSGYPRGLRGDEIPIGARIVAVVDAYVAMTTDRPYRKAMAPAEALSELRKGIAAQFDPVVCASFIKLLIESGHVARDQVVEMAALRSRREAAVGE